MSWNLVISCIVALGCMQASCLALARGFHLRLEGRAIALGLLLPIAVLAPWLLGGDLLVPTVALDGVLPGLHATAAHKTHLLLNDTLYQFLPWELEVRHALRHWRLPLWSDHLDGGSSPWLNPQAAVLSPIALLARLGPIQHFLLLTLALKLLVASEGTWLLVRRLRRSRVAALLAATSFSLGAGVMSWALFPHSAAVAWVPWLTLGTVICCRRPTPLAIAMTALITAAMLLAGHPETALAGGLFAAVCGVGLRRRRIGIHRGLAAAGLAAVVGFGLAAPLLVPFLRAVPASQRARDILSTPAPAHDFHLLQPSSWFVPTLAAYLRSPMSPRAYGVPYSARFEGPFNWVDALSGYAGLVAFVGALVAGLVLRDRKAWIFLGFATTALLFVAGFLPFVRLVYAIHALRGVSSWPRLLPVACLGLAVAAAFGVDALVYARGRVAGRRGLQRCFPWQVALALTLGAVVSLRIDRSPEVVLVWLLIICAPLAARWRQNFGALLVVGASALDLVPWSQHLLPHGEPELFYPANPLIGTLTRETEGGAWRSIGLYKLIYPSLLPVYGLAELRPNNVLAPSDQLDVLRLAFGFNPTALNYYAAVANVDHPLLSFLNVRAVVGHIYLPQPRTLVPILEPRTLPFLVFRNVHALPRWFVPAAVDLIEPEDLPRWIAELDNAGRVAVFREQMEGFTLPPAAGVVSTARLLVGTSGHVELEVPGRGSRLLATSLPLPAGWQAAGGGRKLSTVTVNGAFLGALCPDGVSRITLDFLPPGIETGVVLFALALGVLSTLYWKATGH